MWDVQICGDTCVQVEYAVAGAIPLYSITFSTAVSLTWKQDALQRLRLCGGLHT